MHEMAVVSYIIDAICEAAAEDGATKVLSCTLAAGAARDIHEDLLQTYFDWFSKGTAAEGVQVILNTIPIRYCCEICARMYAFDPKEGRITDPWGDPLPSEKDPGTGSQPLCPEHPDAKIRIVSGLELAIEEITVL